jgi:hypothetical protein
LEIGTRENAGGAMNAKFGICTAIATIIFNIGAAPLVSQEPTATGQASLQPDVETISLDLAVRDRHNRPVLDLKPEELTVADNGKPANSIEEGSGDPYQRSGKDSHAKAALKSIIGAANRAGVNIYVVLLEGQKYSPKPSTVNEACIAGQFPTDSIVPGNSLPRANFNTENPTTGTRATQLTNNGNWNSLRPRPRKASSRCRMT